MVDYEVRWAIIFKKEGLNIDFMKEYLSAENTTIIDIQEDELEVSNSVTNVDTMIPCMIFVMETKSLFVPFKFRRELNLRELPQQKYVFMACE